MGFPALFLAVVTIDYWASQELKDMIPAYEHRCSTNGNEDIIIPYRLFIPTHAGTEETFPLIVWLHGGGEWGRDNDMQLKFMEHTILPDPTAKEKYRFAVLAPQCPTDTYWTQELSDGQDMLSITIDILDHVIGTHPIDPDRITAVGLSRGGDAVWQLANRHPDRFAAIAPMGANLSSTWNSTADRRVPVWAFLSPNDTTMSTQPVIARVEHLKQAGAPIELTLASDHPQETGKFSHYCFVSAFSQYQLLPWLLAQSRTAKDVPPPGYVEWRWRFSWDYLWPRFGRTFLMFAVVVGFFVVGYTYRHSSMRAAAEQTGE